MSVRVVSPAGTVATVSVELAEQLSRKGWKQEKPKAAPKRGRPRKQAE